MGYADASLLVCFLKLLRAAWDLEVAVLFIYPGKIMGAVDPGGGELVFPIILIMSACLRAAWDLEVTVLFIYPESRQGHGCS